MVGVFTNVLIACLLACFVTPAIFFQSLLGFDSPRRAIRQVSAGLLRGFGGARAYHHASHIVLTVNTTRSLSMPSASRKDQSLWAAHRVFEDLPGISFGSPGGWYVAITYLDRVTHSHPGHTKRARARERERDRQRAEKVPTQSETHETTVVLCACLGKKNHRPKGNFLSFWTA